MSKADYRDVVDACYRPAPTDDAWCASFVDALQPLVPYSSGVGVAVFSLRGDAIAIGCHALHRQPEPVNRLATMLAPTLHPDNEGRLLFPKHPLNFVSATFPLIPANVSEYIRKSLAEAEASDLLGVLSYPADDVVAALAFPVRSAAPFTTRARAALLRVRLHMELGLSHRLQSGRQPVAVLRSDGQLAHLARMQLDDDAIAQLGQHVRAVERIRCKRFSGDTFEALMLWDAVVAGRWSTLEQVDADGRRQHLVFENPTTAHRHRALTFQESETLRLYATGMTGKEVAAALGQAPSTISERLATIADKLGLRTRDDVLRLRGRDAGANPAWSSLTTAEREVLGDVVNGQRDAEIARRRRTSVSTVRKQVAALRHKLGASTRGMLSSIHTPRSTL